MEGNKADFASSKPKLQQLFCKGRVLANQSSTKEAILAASRLQYESSGWDFVDEPPECIKTIHVVRLVG